MATSNGSGDYPYRFDVNGCLDGRIGQHGLDEKTLASHLDAASTEFHALQRELAEDRLPVARITSERDDLEEASEAFERLAKGARTVVFFGTGGSGLGGQTLAQVAGWNIPGVDRPGQMKRPRTRFYDNLDPVSMAGALRSLDLAQSRFVVTSKSGGTAETLAQTIATLSAVREAGLGDKIPEMFLGITEPEQSGKSNGLRSLLSDFRIPMLPHPTDIGGRFSCFTIVGLMPALARGLDPFAVRAGARKVVDRVLAAKTPGEAEPVLSAVTSLALAKERGVRVLVLMPYTDRLAYLSRWFVQLWAESLGKNGLGTTPIAATGPLDQHSQLQLFMDGPREHLVTLIRLATEGEGTVLDADMAQRAGAGYLAGRTIGDVVAAQAGALPDALAEACRPVRTIDIHRLDEEAIGSVMMHFMLETILAGRLLGIDPFDQPAVELAKVLTRERLQKPPG